MADQLHLKLWEVMSRLSKSKEVTGDSQHGFTKSKLCLTGLSTSVMRRLALQARGERKMLLTWTLACDMLPHSILTVKREIRTGHVGSATEQGKSSKRVHLPDPVFSVLLFLTGKLMAQ